MGCRAAVIAGLLTIALQRAAFAGPPFLTDDPVPVDLGHFETYVFSQWDNAPGTGSNATGPALEFNWGFLSNLQFHVVAPFANVSASGMPNAFGFGDSEIGIKYRFVQETAGRPQIGFFPLAEVATGDASRGLGNGRTWYRLPLWMQKGFDNDKWTVDAGGGVALNSAAGQLSYGFAGLLVQRAIGSGFTLGAEVYTQGATAIGLTPTTFYNVGAYINPTQQFSILLSAGHNVTGQNHAIGYFGLYYTFPKPAGP
jgi:hypothetical protein